MTAMTVMKFCCNKKILWTSTLFRTCPKGCRLSFINEIILYERTLTQPFQRLSGYRTGHYHPTRYNQSDSERSVRTRPHKEILLLPWARKPVCSYPQKVPMSLLCRCRHFCGRQATSPYPKLDFFGHCRHRQRTDIFWKKRASPTKPITVTSTPCEWDICSTPTVSPAGNRGMGRPAVCRLRRRCGRHHPLMLQAQQRGTTHVRWQETVSPHPKKRDMPM